MLIRCVLAIKTFEKLEKSKRLQKSKKSEKSEIPKLQKQNTLLPNLHPSNTPSQKPKHHHNQR